ncbi:hypothetical protein [Paucibacter sp. PLA-PC-4]|uniref:hypothetical protein n=1 Tax=Paucibacter sp. PLA-PC-4 TaxID=2993655 RepID=UPI002B05CF2E|nr:hypothetical protein [Paucibacter sp. PLA-PC-4]
MVSADESRHQAQDLQSLAMHEEAVRLVRSDPSLLQRAQATLERWPGAGNTRSSATWIEWRDILSQGKWCRVLSWTRRAQAMDQASRLVTVLPEPLRQRVLDQLKAPKKV